MGKCNSSPAASENRKWDKVLNKARKVNQGHKLLLLGTGNSGKSTFFKQLNNIHGQGNTDEELQAKAKHIQDAVVVQMKHILSTFKTDDTDDAKVDLRHGGQHAEAAPVDLPSDLMQSGLCILGLSPEHPLSDVADDIATLWDHEVIKDAYTNRTHLGIADSAPHFFDDLERINQPEYLPTQEDVLLARIPTTGMRSQIFTIKETTFNIYDVGGQRSERSKWIHCFDTVHGILFVASLSCYDQNLFEENALNAMSESLELFNVVSNSRYFQLASLILFLNKSDLFRQKIKSKPLTVCFPDYEGQNEFDEAAKYIELQFKSQSQRKDRAIFSHVTCATDESTVQKVFDDVQHTVVSNALRYNGLI